MRRASARFSSPVWDHQRYVFEKRMKSQMFDRYQGKIWTKESIPLAQKHPQLYGYYHNTGNSRINLLTHYAFKGKLSNTIINTALSLPGCSWFRKALLATETTVLRSLSVHGLAYTLFVPTDAAMSKVEGGAQSLFDQLSLKRQAMDKFCQSHAFRGLIRPTDLMRYRTLKNLTGGNTRVIAVKGSSADGLVSARRQFELSTIERDSKGRLLASGYPSSRLVISAPYRSSNGFVYLIDRPLAMSVAIK